MGKRVWVFLWSYVNLKIESLLKVIGKTKVDAMSNHIYKIIIFFSNLKAPIKSDLIFFYLFCFYFFLLVSSAFCDDLTLQLQCFTHIYIYIYICIHTAMYMCIDEIHMKTSFQLKLVSLGLINPKFNQKKKVSLRFNHTENMI